ncbi:hypothetical protein D3C83_111160 [compost metagenome]
MRGKTGRFEQIVEKIAVLAAFQEYLGVDVQEQPALGDVLVLKILHMNGPGQPVQQQGAEEVVASGKNLQRRHRLALAVLGDKNFDANFFL